MIDAGECTAIVLYDGECGFCQVMLAALLNWDRARRFAAAAIQSARGERLLAEMPATARLASWHLVQGASIRSGSAAVPVVLGVLPGGASLGAVSARFPRATSRAYDWVASHRALLGRFFGGRARAWAARVIVEREQQSATQ
ncbi:MAG TPA: DCC1-like thiol-disulfide oxidoreductase family protein [Solirubrobacteraceae bacterium]|jgi:predicted DCC family thiol-disulfide oxidoreductase YuxK|nr:DCC1-like thiol-disulfide oxidoreductase family protein [Solirubrobacteraceae bacterium]